MRIGLSGDVRGPHIMMGLGWSWNLVLLADGRLYGYTIDEQLETTRFYRYLKSTLPSGVCQQTYCISKHVGAHDTCAPSCRSALCLSKPQDAARS